MQDDVYNICYYSCYRKVQFLVKIDYVFLKKFTTTWPQLPEIFAAYYYSHHYVRLQLLVNVTT